MRVAHVITDTNIGGAGKILLSLLHNRDRENFDMTVVIPYGSLLKPELDGLGCKLVEARSIADKSLSFAGVFELADILRALRPDIVHTHASMSARIAARLFIKDCKIVNTRHSVFDVPRYKKRFPYKTVSGIFNNYFSDRIIAVSPAAVENMTDIGVDPSKISVVFNGADPVKRLNARERLAVRQRYGLSETDFICAIIARLENFKGHEYVIEACKKLPPGIKVVIAGTGSEEANLKAAAKDLDNCIFAGFVKEIWEIENIMDLQLNASCGAEATSVSLLEGMSLGIPSIVSDAGGNPYVIETGVNGLVIPSGDADAICAAIMELKNNGERYKAMSKNCERIFADRFTSKLMTEATEQVYKELG